VLRPSPYFNSAEDCTLSLVFVYVTRTWGGREGIGNNGKRNFGTPVARSRVFCIQLYIHVQAYPVLCHAATVLGQSSDDVALLDDIPTVYPTLL